MSEDQKELEAIEQAIYDLNQEILQKESQVAVLERRKKKLQEKLKVVFDVKRSV